MRTPKVGTVIIDQLRKIKFEPYRLWQPPLTQPVAIDDLVNRFLGRPWHKEYGSACNLVFPIGIIDRPYKHDQPPWTVDTSGPGANVLILGAGGSGKTTALQTLICSAALTHTPQQVQFYCLAYSSTALTTVSRIPTWARLPVPPIPTVCAGRWPSCWRWCASANAASWNAESRRWRCSGAASSAERPGRYPTTASVTSTW